MLFKSLDRRCRGTRPAEEHDDKGEGTRISISLSLPFLCVCAFDFLKKFYSSGPQFSPERIPVPAELAERPDRNYFSSSSSKYEFVEE